MDQRIAYIQESTSSLPACPQQKTIREAAEREAAVARAQIEREGDFVEVTARLLVSVNRNLDTPFDVDIILHSQEALVKIFDHRCPSKRAMEQEILQQPRWHQVPRRFSCPIRELRSFSRQGSRSMASFGWS